MNKKASRLDSLTGMRFLAALAVFVHHIDGRFFLPHVKLPLGLMAVSFFFVLSGFILTYVYEGRLKWKGVKRFYVTRWARIWPLHAVTLLATILIFQSSLRHESVWTFVANVFLLQSWVPTDQFAFSFNSPSWSISTELFFYLMFPLMLLGGEKKFWRKYLLVAIGTFAFLFVSQQFANRGLEWTSWINFERLAHANPFTRLFEFCSGMAIGYVYLRYQSKFNLETEPNRNAKVTTNELGVGVATLWETVALLAIVVYAFGYMSINPGVAITRTGLEGVVYGAYLRFAGGVFVFSLTVYVFATCRGLWTHLLGSRWMVFLGEISFALYMVHMAVIRAVQPYDWAGSYISNWGVAACILAISICFSVFLYKLVEMPAKTMLVKSYDGDWREGCRSWMRSARSFFGSRVGISTCVALVLAFGVLKAGHRTQDYSPGAHQLASHENAKYPHAEFGKVAKLKAFVVETTEQGVEIQMAWQKLSESNYYCVVQICDEYGKAIYSKRRMLEKLSGEKNCLVGDTFEDSIVLNRRQLLSGKQIRVGFFQKGRGRAKLTRQKRGDDWRYTLVNKNEFQSDVLAQLPDIEVRRRAKRSDERSTRRR